MLFTLFDALGYKPNKIIFIDDKLKYVKSVEQEAKKHSVEYVGIRYSLQDQKKATINFEELNRSLHQVEVQVGIEPLD